MAQCRMIPGEDLYLTPVAFSLKVKENKLHFYDAHNPNNTFIPWDISTDGYAGQMKNVKHVFVFMRRLWHAFVQNILLILRYRMSRFDILFNASMPFYAVSVSGVTINMNENQLFISPHIESTYVRWDSPYILSLIEKNDPRIVIRDKTKIRSWIDMCHQNDYEIYFIQEINT